MPRLNSALFSDFLVLVATLGCLTGAPGCSSDPAAPEEPAQRNVAVEAGNREQATIGPDGGTLSTTNDAGVTFTLDVPPGAVAGDVAMSMTPVKSIQGLPFSGGLAAAVSLQPSGLYFVRPAWLRIATTVTPGANEQLVGFTYEGDAREFAFTAGVQAAGEIRVLVPHFSGAGAGLASPEDLSAPGFMDTLSVEYKALFWPAVDPDGWLLRMAACLTNDIVPEIDRSSGDDLRLAVVKFFRWQEMLQLETIYGVTDAYGILLNGHIIPARAVIARKLEEGIRVAKERCAFTGEVYPLTSVFEFWWQAFFLNLDTFENGLDPESVLDGICASAVIERMTLANPLPLDADRSFDIDFALEINGVRMDGVFDVGVTGIGGTVQHPKGITDGKGKYTTVVRRTLEAGVQFNVVGELRLPMFGFNDTSSYMGATLLSVDADMFRGGTASIQATFPGSVAPGQPTPLTVEVKQLVAPGQEVPVDGAVVTFTATGGTVNPAQAATGLNGRAQTSVTASNSATQVVVTVVVTKDGVEIGREQVSAAVTNGGVVLLKNRSSFAQVNTAPHDSNCTGLDEDTDQSNATGFATVTAFAQRDCDNGQDQASASAMVTQSSDPGVAADNRSATLTFSGSGSASRETKPTIGASSGASTSLAIDFEIQGAQMGFQLDASFTASNDGFMGISLARDGTVFYIWGKQLGDANPSSILVAGNLLPGNYSAFIEVSGSPVGAVALATFSGNVTFTLTQAEAALADVSPPGNRTDVIEP